MGFVLQVWFYLTPIIYSENLVPEKWRWLSICNPLAYLFSAIHTILIFGEWPQWWQIAISAGWSFLAFALALVIYRHFSPTLIERV
jgi:lipopolysaccharide transport system permease protein